MSAEALNETLRVALANIARGYWNVGRDPRKLLTVHEYAREALRAAGLSDDPKATW